MCIINIIAELLWYVIPLITGSLRFWNKSTPLAVSYYGCMISQPAVSDTTVQILEKYHCHTVAKSCAVTFSGGMYVGMRTDYLTIVFMSVDCVCRRHTPIT